MALLERLFRTQSTLECAAFLTSSTNTGLFHQRDGGVTGVQTEGRRPCGDESYCAASCTSVTALLSYMGDPDEGAVAKLVRLW